MEETRRFRIPLRPVLLLLLVAALVANIPMSWFHEQTTEQRRAEVFSAFVHLTDEPGQGDLPFLKTLADLSGQSWHIREKRYEHVHPDLLSQYAARIGLSAEAMEERLLNPNLSGPFDVSQATRSRVGFATHGISAPWFWGVTEHAAAREVVGEGDLLAGCAIWVVFWTASDWYFAPIGTPEMNELLVSAVPDLSDLPFDTLPRCVSGD